MAQFRSTADLVDSILTRCGEVTNGNSTYDSDGTVLSFLNRVHFSLISGGTIALGKDVTIEIDETWPWAKSKAPMVLELQPKYDSATVNLTLASESGTLSVAPSYSLEGWYLSVSGVEGIYRIGSHTASSTSFELDAAWPNTSVTAGTCKIFKLDYDLIPAYITVNDENKYIQLQKTSGSTLTGTLTKGVYTPADLISHVATVSTSTLSGPTVTGSYSALTRKFSLISDLAGGTSFIIVGNGNQSLHSIHKTLGYDDETTTSAGTQTSTYILGGIARLIEPFKCLKGSEQEIFGIDSESFSRDYTFEDIEEGNPTRFCVIREDDNGAYRVRFNRYPKEKTRVEIEHVQVPRDLKDNSSSIPLVPRKHIDVLEDAGAFYISFLKNDDKLALWAQLTQGKLFAMINQHRGQLLRSAKDFGRAIPRRDLSERRRRRLFPTEPY